MNVFILKAARSELRSHQCLRLPQKTHTVHTDLTQILSEKQASNCMSCGIGIFILPNLILSDIKAYTHSLATASVPEISVCFL